MTNAKTLNILFTILAPGIFGMVVVLAIMLRPYVTDAQCLAVTVSCLVLQGILAYRAVTA